MHAGEPCVEATYNVSLAAFLLGFGKHSYYFCSDGWQDTTGWMQWRADFDRDLGAPLSDMHIDAHNDENVIILKRAFESGTNVTMHLPKANGGTSAPPACIRWSDGAITATNTDICL